MCTACACSSDVSAELNTEATTPAATTLEYTLEGVTCGGCATTVTNAVEALGGMSAQVDVATATLTVTGDDVDDAAVRTAVSAAGYGIAS